MFTGLVEETGTVVSSHGTADYRLISIRAPKVVGSLRPGDSLSVNGACQTVVRVEGAVASVEALSETLAKTNLGGLSSGSVVNLERPLTPQSRFDGHIVQGHVDGQGRVADVRRAGEGYYLTVSLPSDLARGCLAQGSIALDGISLTIAHLCENRMTVNVIPTTWRETTLSARKNGDAINVEIDVIGRYVFRYLETAGGRGAGMPGHGSRAGGGPYRRAAGAAGIHRRPRMRGSKTSGSIDSGLGKIRLEATIEALRQGRMVVVTDDEDRENEGDLVALATDITTETVAFMARFGRGLICQPITEGRARTLDLPLMVSANQESHRTAFTVSVDAADGITTGISAADRARSIRTVMDPDACPGDLVRPGHVFPLIAREGGVIERPGHTEAAIDLARLAGSAPGAVICEILGDDGLALTGEDLRAFCRHHELVSLTIQDLIRRNDKKITVSRWV